MIGEGLSGISRMGRGQLGVASLWRVWANGLSFGFVVESGFVCSWIAEGSRNLNVSMLRRFLVAR